MHPYASSPGGVKGLFVTASHPAHVVGLLVRACRLKGAILALLAFLAQAAVLHCGSGPLWAGEATRTHAVSLLRRCLQTQARMDHMSMRVTTVRDVTVSVGGWPREQHADSVVRRDGDRLDIIGRYAMPSDKPDLAKARSHRSRTVLTRDMGVWYYCPLNWSLPPKLGIVSHDWNDTFVAHGVNEITSGPLDGYLPPTGSRRVAEVMLEATALGIHGTENINGTQCTIVKAQTPHGAYALWIAESKGCLPLKVTYDIGPGDLHDYTDDRPFAEVAIFAADGQRKPGSKATGIVDEIAVAQIGTAFVPVSGKFTKDEWYADVRLFNVNAYKRIEVKLDPLFRGTEAFVIDLPDGARINNMADQTSGVKYEWRAGNVIPAGGEYGGGPAVASWERRPRAVEYILGICGIALFGTGLSIALHAKGLGQHDRNIHKEAAVT